MLQRSYWGEGTVTGLDWAKRTIEKCKRRTKMNSMVTLAKSSAGIWVALSKEGLDWKECSDQWTLCDVRVSYCNNRDTRNSIIEDVCWCHYLSWSNSACITWVKAVSPPQFPVIEGGATTDNTQWATTRHMKPGKSRFDTFWQSRTWVQALCCEAAAADNAASDDLPGLSSLSSLAYILAQSSPAQWSCRLSYLLGVHLLQAILYPCNSSIC